MSFVWWHATLRPLVWEGILSNSERRRRRWRWRRRERRRRRRREWGHRAWPRYLPLDGWVTFQNEGETERISLEKPAKVKRISSKISLYETSRLLIRMLSASYYTVHVLDAMFAIMAYLRTFIPNSLIYSSYVVSFQWKGFLLNEKLSKRIGS